MNVPQGRCELCIQGHSEAAMLLKAAAAAMVVVKEEEKETVKLQDSSVTLIHLAGCVQIHIEKCI